MPDPWERGRPARSGPQAHDCRPYGRAARVPGHASLGNAPSRQPQALYDRGPGYPGNPRLRRVAGGTPALPGSQPALGSGHAGLGPFHVRPATGLPACPPTGRFHVRSAPGLPCRPRRHGARREPLHRDGHPLPGGRVTSSAAWGARREPLRLPAPDPFRIPPFPERAALSARSGLLRGRRMARGAVPAARPEPPRGIRVMAWATRPVRTGPPRRNRTPSAPAIVMPVGVARQVFPTVETVAVTLLAMVVSAVLI